MQMLNILTLALTFTLTYQPPFPSRLAGGSRAFILLITITTFFKQMFLLLPTWGKEQKGVLL